MIKTLLACGIDPQKTTVFIQSHVKEHCELAWILSCFANQHLLNFMIQYKEKKTIENREKNRKTAAGCVSSFPTPFS